MSMTAETRDRYVTFNGLDCDANADRVMAFVNEQLAQLEKDDRWIGYFDGKFAEQQRMGVDNLFFVGSQMNVLRAFFEEQDNEAAIELLYQVEQECC